MMNQLLQRFSVLVTFLRGKEEGQGLAEYALILVLVAIVCVVALLFLGTSISNVLNNVAQNLTSHQTS